MHPVDGLAGALLLTNQKPMHLAQEGYLSLILISLESMMSQSSVTSWNLLPDIPPIYSVGM